MSGTWGNRIRFTIFGESHGKAIGGVIDGLMPGIKLNLEAIRFQMARRAPGRNDITTSRKEKDDFEILSGFFNGYTTGSSLAFVIRNEDKKQGDYEKIKDIPRPSHADYTAKIKYKGFNDYRGGGSFSGRLTAPMVFAGAICRQILELKGIYIGSHIKSIGKVEDACFDSLHIDNKLLHELGNEDIPLIDGTKRDAMKKEILKAKGEGDSVGGIIECAIIGLEPGIGEPYFQSVESCISHIIFSIPGIKGIEFGAGFEASKMKGSQANDQFYIKEGKIGTKTNHSGGLQGGITNGMPVIFRAAVKPTPSIEKIQNSIDIKKMEEIKLKIQGRHDPCIVTRALPVVESAAAIAVLDLLQ